LLDNVLLLAPLSRRRYVSIALESTPGVALPDWTFSMAANPFLRTLRWLSLNGAIAVALCLQLHAQTSQGLSPSADPLAGSQSPASSQRAGTSSKTDSITGVNASQNIGNDPASGGETSIENDQTQDLSPMVFLSTDQIMAVLQEQPDALVELKSLVADLATQQGTPLQPDSVSDEMLYSKIASSPQLRANVTTFLHARGYISDADLQNYAVSNFEGDGLPSSMNSQAARQDSYGTNLAIGSLSGTYGQQGAWRGNTNGSDARMHNNSRDASSNATRGTTSPPQVLRLPTPYNLLSLHDLYTQLPQTDSPLKRFGSDFFLRREGMTPNRIAASGSEIPLDVPAGPSYVVGPGDSLSIDLWGGISQNITRTIDREGRLTLPESGAVQVAGLTLERVQSVVAETLKQQYRNVQVAVTVAHLRSIRVYVVGDVQRPGAYDISSLSTTLNALYAAGGPTSVGSLRVVRHYRDKLLVRETDLYDFLLHGVQNEDRLQAGDTVLVPSAGPQIAVYGAVKRPAIYERGHTRCCA
jgi:protein involved in polysaccharide export with SLBB domain